MNTILEQPSASTPSLEPIRDKRLRSERMAAHGVALGPSRLLAKCVPLLGLGVLALAAAFGGN